MTLLTGSASHDRSWPEGLELEAKFRQALELMLSDQPKHSFVQAAEVLKVLESIVLPASKADPELYSRNVQRYMADALGVPACQDWGIEESRALYSVLDENYAKSS